MVWDHSWEFFGWKIKHQKHFELYRSLCVIFSCEDMSGIGTILMVFWVVLCVTLLSQAVSQASKLWKLKIEAGILLYISPFCFSHLPQNFGLKRGGVRIKDRVIWNLEPSTGGLGSQTQRVLIGKYQLIVCAPYESGQYQSWSSEAGGSEYGFFSICCHGYFQCCVDSYLVVEISRFLFGSSLWGHFYD